jgi:hypothetical protein
VKVFIRGQSEPFEVVYDPEELWIDYSRTMKGEKRVQIPIAVKRQVVWVTIESIDADRTFTEAICDAHNTDPPPTLVSGAPP